VALVDRGVMSAEFPAHPTAFVSSLVAIALWLVGSAGEAIAFRITSRRLVAQVTRFRIVASIPVGWRSPAAPAPFKKPAQAAKESVDRTSWLEDDGRRAQEVREKQR